MDKSDISGPSMVTSSLPRQTCVEHNFLFVNETGSSQGFKIGGRADIRSHVRRRAVNRSQQKNPPQAALRKETTGKYRVLAPLTGIDHAASNVVSADEGLASGLPSSTLQVARPPTNPKPLDKNKILPSNIPLEELEALNFDYEISRLEISADPARPGEEEDFAIQEAPQAYCATCGAALYTWRRSKNRKEKDGMPVARMSLWTGPLNCSPLQCLGAGRVDPFSTLPVDEPKSYLHELMDHTITYLLPGLVPDSTNSVVNPVSKAWFESSLKFPMLFHAMIFAGSIHLDYLYSSQIYPNSQRALSHKLAVIQKLNQIIADPKQAARDEVILAILILASHETMGTLESEERPFNSPLRNAQWLNVYGNIKYVPEHMNAVMEIVTMKGGLESLELYGLAETIISGDLIASTNSLSKPALPPLRRSEIWITSVMRWATSSPRMPTQMLGRGFLALRDYGLTTDAIYVFIAMGATTIAIDHHVQGNPGCLSLGAISTTRTAVQQRLLLLPPATEVNELPLLNPNVYESCRLAAFIYSIAVVFPIPNCSKVLQELAHRLQTSIETSEIESLSATTSDFLLWILVLGGIAALSKPQRAWFVTEVAKLVNSMQISNWKSVEAILEHFLWLESACGPGGKLFWSEVLELP